MPLKLLSGALALALILAPVEASATSLTDKTANID
ncbi:MAG: hypothetical protein JWM80_6732, partial [Cyanobacteria bacterium RYN_339]|nr:hypothetical protein [Cyanobacteria bacterium RYN_339]